MRGNKKISQAQNQVPQPSQQAKKLGTTRNLVHGPRWNIPSPENQPVCGRLQHREIPASPTPSPRISETAPLLPAIHSRCWDWHRQWQQSSDTSTMPVPPRGYRINHRRRNLECHVLPPAPYILWGDGLAVPSTVYDDHGQRERKRLVLRRLLVCRLPNRYQPDKIQGRPPRRGLRSSRDGDGVHAMDERAACGGRFQTFQRSGPLMEPGGWVLGQEARGGGIKMHCGGGEVFFVLHLAIAMAGRMMESHSALDVS